MVALSRIQRGLGRFEWQNRMPDDEDDKDAFLPVSQ